MAPWVFGVDSSGAVRYETVLDGRGKLFDVLPRGDGSVWAAGQYNPDGAPPQVLLASVAADGTVDDRWTYGGDGGDDANVVVPLGDGPALAGRTLSYGDPGTSALLQRVDGDGTTLGRTTWSPAEGTATVEDGVALPGGGAALVGRWEPDGTESDGLAVVRVGADGRRRWTTTVDGDADLRTPRVARAGDGTLVVGYDEGTGRDSQPHVRGFDLEGEREWATTDLPSYADVRAVASAADGDAWVVATRGGGPARVLKVAPDGARRWARQFDAGTPGIENAAAGTDRGLLVAGRTTEGETDGYVDAVQRINAAPEPAVSVSPEQRVAGQEVTFDASGATDPDGEVVAYRWDLDGDGAVDAEGERVTHRFASGGTRTVTLWVADDAGAERSTTVTLEVGTATPTSDVTAPGVGAAGAVAGVAAAALARALRR
jgi:hypothetical protein